MTKSPYNAEDGLSEDASIRLYQRAAAFGDNRIKLEAELQAAFSRANFSWRYLLCNDEYEIADLETEDEAREYVRHILWDPLFGKA